MFRYLMLWALAALWAQTDLQGRPPVRSLEGVVADSAGSGPLVGASVLLMTPGDTLLRITDSRGAFRFESVRDSSVRLRIGYLGYRGTTRNVSTTAGTNWIDTVFLGEIPISLGEIVVQGRRPLMSERGDTIVYHAENVRVLPGDEALQIVRGLPGMELKEGEVRFMGKTIERTYVDGRPLFGENARSALDFLAANDVVDIQVYDELPEEERLKGNKNGKKRTVMNLVTRSKPEKSVNVEALAGYGADIDRGPDGHRKGRYGAGASYNYFSERRIYSVEANSNNNNQSSNRIRDRFASYAGGGDEDRRSTTLGASLTHRYGKHLTLSGNYRFANERSETQRITQQIYFPSEAYRSRSYTDTTRASRLGRQHSANLDLRYNPKNDYLVFATSVQYSDDLSHSYRGARNELDGETTNRVGATERNREKSRNLSGRLIWAHSFKNNPKRAIHMNAQGSTSRDDASGWRIDSLSTDNDRTFLETTAGGWSRSLGGNFSYTEPLGEKSSVTAGYGISVDNSHSKRMAVDRFTGLIDTTSTYDYTRNYTTQTAELGFNRYSQTCYLFVRMGYQSARQNRDEAFPETHDDRRTFRSLQPSLSFHYSIGQTRNLYFNYSGSVRQPSVEQLRAELDTRNRLSLTGGTPGLRQSYTHSVSLGYYHTDTKSSRSVGFNLSADLTVRDIATRQRFFAEDTPLEQYGGYVAPKGSTLTTPVNVNGSGSVQANGNFSTPLKPLKSVLNCTAGIGYSRRPSYIGEELDYTNSLSPRIGVHLTGNQSTVCQFSLSANLSYNHSSNSLRDDNSTITQQTGAQVRVNFLKHAYFETNYAYYLYHSFSYAGGDVDTHTWNLSLGVKLFKNRSGDISLTVYDILNRNESFTSSMMSDYVTNNWSRMFGRYWTIGIGYKFNKTGKLKAKP